MPLVRLGLRNEFGLGDPQLYKVAFRKEEEEPKAVLDGIAVAGLVGILRQLGDLADFAATVFHDLHEQITLTRIRGRKMMTRVRNIEAALPSAEKALKDQQRHIHFAYVEGSDWHACLQDEQNLLRSSELPRFMMDSYEECRDPPRLYLLDKFDHAGNGACLRRYSDPSYFKRMWAASQVENTETLRVDKKLQKIKRKEWRKRNRGVQHAGYVSRHDNRTMNHDRSLIFASSSSGEQRFVFENVSLPDMKLSTEFSSRSASFGSKSKEGYAEQSSSVNPPVVTASALDVDDEPSADSMDDVPQHDFLHEESIPRSSSITWDEKIEIVQSTSPASYDDIHVDRVQDSQDVIRDQDSQSQPIEVDSEPEAIDHAKIEVSDGAHFLSDIGRVTGPLSGAKHFDEVTSEADNYVDALNTLDSETDTEAECCTKREVKLPHNFIPQGTESGTGTVPVVAVQNSDFYSVEEAQELAMRFSHLSSSDGLEHVESPYATESLQNQECSAVKDHNENNACGVSESKGHVCECVDVGRSPNPDTSSSLTTEVIEWTGEVSTMKNSPISDVTDTPTIRIWTNGGLFGVEPSKPPELGAANIQSEKPVSGFKNFSSDFSSYTVKSQMIANELNAKSDGFSDVGFSHELKANGERNNLSSPVHRNSTNGRLYTRGYTAVQRSEGSAFGNDDHCDSDVKQEPQVSLQLLSQTKFDKSPEETSISNKVSSHEVDMTRDSAISSSFSELAQRSLANTLQRKAALSTHSGSSIEIGKSEETSPCHSEVVSNGVALKAYYKEHINEELAHVSPNSRLSSTSHCPEESSPPLEYMKMSFHPVNGSENSKLKLEFSGGGLHENSDDIIFPSFLLHQGRVEPDVCSESDEDTFCRSCPYSSEDIPSPRSYSNSEQWEEDEKSECINPEINDADQRFQSSSPPISRSMQFEQMNHSNIGAPGVLGGLDAQNSQVLLQAKSTADLPGLESVLLGNQQQEIFHSSPEIKANTEVQSKVEPPPPPPLPPAQWTMKPSATSKDNDANVPSSINHLDRPQVIQCSRREERPSPKSPSVVAVISPDSNEKQDEQKLNPKKRPNRSAIREETDVREDLLHQIRNQSFNLRRTARPAPRDVPQSTNNVADVNVAAILKKARAIRQAFVGSDDAGDDDNWSDV